MGQHLQHLHSHTEEDKESWGQKAPLTEELKSLQFSLCMHTMHSCIECIVTPASQLELKHFSFSRVFAGSSLFGVHYVKLAGELIWSVSLQLNPQSFLQMFLKAEVSSSGSQMPPPLLLFGKNTLSSECSEFAIPALADRR